MLVPGILLGPWRSIDYVAVAPEASYREPTHIDVEEFAYVIAGRGRAHVDDEEAAISAGDAVPVLRGQEHWFAGEGESDLDLMIVGIAVT